MPASPLRSPRAFDDLEGALAILREDGGRVSAPRRALLETLFSAPGPLSAEQLAEAAGARPLDVASTHRTLDHLERRGLVRHVHLGHGPGLYELAGAGEREYAVCERCSAVRAVPPSILDAARAEIERAVGYRARFGHFPVVGLCERCAGVVGGTGSGVRHHGGRHERKDEPMEHPHSHDEPHAHEHEHDGASHSHAHTGHDHDHVEHEHEHSHGDVTHSHSHAHEPGLEEDHAHQH